MRSLSPGEVWGELPVHSSSLMDPSSQSTASATALEEHPNFIGNGFPSEKVTKATSPQKPARAPVAPERCGIPEFQVPGLSVLSRMTAHEEKHREPPRESSALAFPSSQCPAALPGLFLRDTNPWNDQLISASQLRLSDNPSGKHPCCWNAASQEGMMALPEPKGIQRL